MCCHTCQQGGQFVLTGWGADRKPRVKQKCGWKCHSLTSAPEVFFHSWKFGVFPRKLLAAVRACWPALTMAESWLVVKRHRGWTSFRCWVHEWRQVCVHGAHWHAPCSTAAGSNMWPHMWWSAGAGGRILRNRNHKQPQCCCVFLIQNYRRGDIH